MPRFSQIILTALVLLLNAGRAANAQEDGNAMLDAPSNINIKPYGIVSQPTEMQGWSGTGWNALHLAVITGDMNLAAGFTVEMLNAGDAAVLTPLHYAVASGNPAI